MRHYLTAILMTLTLCMIMLSSCRDELLYNQNIIGEGEGTVSFNMRFEPITPALEETRTAGNAIKNIENVSVVVFYKNQKLYRIFRSVDKELKNLEIITSGNNSLAPDRPSDTQTTETGTAVATFSLEKMPFGEYYFYVVANLDLDEKDIQTPDDLKGISVPWEPDWNPSDSDSEKYLSNKAMFGYFRDDESKPTTGFNAPLVAIGKEEVQLSAWIRRLASKITVAFDPKDLNESVNIYIKSVTIHDIPKSCYLGKDNKPDDMDQLFTTGETINYYTEGNENNIEGWLHLLKGTPVQDNHKDESNALFFFENMQGDYEGQRDYYKPQIQGETNGSINDPVRDDDGNIMNDFKDRVEFGTYIEVKGYYDSKNPDNLSSGPITYRFMLGQNTTFNYDAIRNHHYKLTLKFKGWANEPDWHIVYEEPTPTIFLPSPYYISYLYNQSMEMPVRIVGLDENARQNYYLRSEIIENNWIPYDTETQGPPPSQIEPLTDINGFAWDQTSYENEYSTVVDGKRKPDNYVGFLSVRANEATIVGNTMSYGDDANKALKDYYEGKPANFGEMKLQVNPRYVAYYYLDDEADKIPILAAPGTQEQEDDGYYGVKYTDSNDIRVNVPFYTRAKELVSASDFTANNPFYAYQRKAVVRFTLRDKSSGNIVPFKVMTLDDEKQMEVSYKDIIIYQVRRIVNPKGIWRSYDSEESFDVTLMHLKDGGSDEFMPFKSEGKWRVSVIKDPDDLILIDGKKLSDTDYIEGSSGTQISFTYKPNGTIGKNETRCGIIKVEYHDYTCNHLIFVRQGYDAPVELGVDNGDYSSKAKWSCYNVVAAEGDGTKTAPQDRTKAKTYVTKSPLSIGSFFKRCQYNYAILESNNSSYGWLANIGPLKTAYIDSEGEYIERDNIAWSSFGGWSWHTSVGESRFDKAWATDWDAINMDDDVKNKNFAFPTIEHYRGLRDGCEFGYGIVYADGASKVAENISDACGFTDYDNNYNESNKAINAKGMRVCIVYNPDNGDQILFPLGAEGQGRRARMITQIGSNGSSGSLSYGGINGLLTSSLYRPLTYNLYRNPGALYWFKQPGLKDYSPNNEPTTVASWDINYYTLVFNPYSHVSLATNYPSDGNLSDSSDALPIRLIYRE